MEPDVSRLVDALPDLVWTAGPDGACEFVNRRWRDYSGMTLDPYRASGWSSIIHPDDLLTVRAAWNAAVAAGTPVEFEARLRRFDGIYRSFRIKAEPFHDEMGRLSGWCGVNTDIEGQKWAEAQLAAEKQLLELVARGVSLAEVLEHLCLLVEGLEPGAMCSILFADSDELRFRVGAGPSLPAPYNAVLDGLRIDPFFGPCSLAITTKSTIITVDPPSDPRWRTSSWPAIMDEFGLRSCWSAPIFGSRDQVLGIFAIYRHEGVGPTAQEQELIDRFAKLAGIAMERAESDAMLATSAAELRRANSYLAGAQRLSKTGSFTLDPLSDEQFWSAENYRIWEFDPAVPPTMEMVLATIHPDDRDRAFRALSEAVKAGEDLDVSYRIVTPAGGVKYLHTVSMPIPEVTDRAVFLGSTQDITEAKLAEADLNHARAELAHVARVAALSALTASIAHEVNQPLAGIITNANTCLRMLASNPPNVEGARATAQRTIRDGNRASEVIKRLRDLFARKPRELERVDLNEAAREVLALTSSELQRRRLIVRTELRENLPSVLADRVQLQQVILNLVLNAADAMIEVEDQPREMWISSRAEADRLVSLSVRDVGRGLEETNLEQLFQPFHSTKADGMGIGLAVSRSIIEAHGGRLWGASNDDGPGAIFSFSVPCDQAASAE
jgi:PAS domain S-box-containing protein